MISCQQEGAGQLPETSVGRFQQKRGETSEGRKFHHHRAVNVDSNLHRDSSNIMISSITGPPAKPTVASEKNPPQEPCVSKVPLRVTAHSILLTLISVRRNSPLDCIQSLTDIKIIDVSLLVTDQIVWPEG